MMTSNEYFLHKEVERLKKEIEEYKQRMGIRRGDVVLLKDYSFDPEAGEHVKNGCRPYLVVSNDKGNLKSPIIICSPLTTNNKRDYLPTHIPISYNGSVVCCETLKTFDKSNVDNIIFHLDVVEINKVNEGLKKALELN